MSIPSRAVSRWLLGGALGCCAALWCSAAPAQGSLSGEASLQRRIAELIEQLADGNYHSRVNAKWELERIGLPAFEQLRQAASEHPNVQIAREASYLVESQQVTWWQETDSIEVRELLRNYNDLAEVERETLLGQLAELGSDDALLALCRLTRFESSELRSKSAALHLMQAIAKRLEDVQSAESVPAAGNSGDSSEPTRAIDASLPNSIRLTLGDSQRVATSWLQALMSELLESHRPTEAHVDGLASWRQLIAAEHAATAPSGARHAIDSAYRQQLSITLRFYRWLSNWATRNYDRASALELVRPSLELVGENALALRTAASWVLESDLPELLPALSERYPEEFAAETQLGYLLAEAWLRLGDQQAAEQAAEQASLAIREQLEARRVTHNLPEILASRHSALAGQLTLRGLHAWAEREYQRALTFESSWETEAMIRDDLARFYWFGGEHDKASQALRPVVQRIESGDADLPPAPGDFSSPGETLAGFYFYDGLAAIDRGEKELAFAQLSKALEVEAALPNPDVVIAMSQIADEEPYRSRFQAHFESMSNDFRVRVANAEEELARAGDRRLRAMAGPTLASECNQLAWLLSKCRQSPKEALNLSLRSLELQPDQPDYLDTLARCYFSDNQIKQAVRVQKRAVKLAPHERQMAVQLQEFQRAWQDQQQSQQKSESD